MDKIVRASVADLLINLSAGWFGLAYGVIFLTDRMIVAKIVLLIFDVITAMLFLYIAIKLRRRFKK